MEETFDMKFSTDLGRYLKTNRSFTEGDHIYEEEPLIVYPYPGEEKVYSTDFICYGCCKVIEKCTALHCPRCNWYACSEECIEERWHTEFECKIFDTMDIIPCRYTLKYVYLVRVLLLRENDLQAWHKLIRLSSYVTLMDKELLQNLKDDAEMAHEFLTEACGFDVSKVRIGRLMRLFTINSFGIWEYDKSGNTYSGAALYGICCFLAHSCSYNADWKLLPVNDEEDQRWKLIIIANRNIKTGQVLTIPYCDYVQHGTMKRREKIARGYNFSCCCERCADPTELGTYYSALLCGSCPGAVLPKNPLDFDTDWQCDLCEKEMYNDSVEALESRFTNAMEEVLKIKNKELRYKRLSFLLKTSEKYGLHQNHNLMVVATMKWLKMTNLDHLLGTGEDVSMQYRCIVKRAKHCLDIHNRLGNTIDSLFCESLLASAIIKFRFKSKNSLSIDFDPYERSQKILFLKQICRHLRKAIVAFRITTYNLYDNSEEDQYIALKEMFVFFSEVLMLEVTMDENFDLPDFAEFLQDIP